MAIALIGVVARPSPAAAQTPSGPVLLLVPVGELAGADDLLSALDAHLADLGVEVRVVEVGERPGGDPIDAAAAGRAIDAAGAMSACWYDAPTGRLSILTPRVSDRPAVRELPETDVGQIARADSLAAIVYSEIAPLIGPVPVYADHDPAPPDDEPAPAEPAPPPRQPLEVGLGVGYVPLLMSSDGPLLHGAAFDLRLGLPPYLEVSLGIDLLARAALDVPGEQVELVQVPLRPALRATIPVGDLTFGFALGAVFDIWYLKGLGYALADSAVAGKHLAFGASMALVARYRVTPWLAPFVELGADFYPQPERHVYEDRTLLRLASLRARGSVGLAFYWGVR